METLIGIVAVVVLIPVSIAFTAGLWGLLLFPTHVLRAPFYLFYTPKDENGKEDSDAKMMGCCGCFTAMVFIAPVLFGAGGVLVGVGSKAFQGSGGQYSRSPVGGQTRFGPEPSGRPIGSDIPVRGTLNADGTTKRRPHYRTYPDGLPSNNYSTKGNVNPYTGRKGDR